MGNKLFFPDRYREVRNAAQTRTIFSIGIAVFHKYNKELSSTEKEQSYKCKVKILITLNIYDIQYIYIGFRLPYFGE